MDIIGLENLDPKIVLVATTTFRKFARALPVGNNMANAARNGCLAQERMPVPKILAICLFCDPH